MLSLVAFLGNFGREYSGTRHNAAWIFSDETDICAKLSWQSKFRGQFAADTSLVSAGLRETPVYFLKPETYMNLSGESIGEVSRFYKIKPEEILVVHDELELPPGTVSLKWSGGLGGHNGLRSAKSVLGTPDFWRLRFGIGRPEHDDVAGYVLSPFSTGERIDLSRTFPETEKLLLKLLTVKNPADLLPSWKKKNFIAE